MIGFASLGSGSKGNGTLVVFGETRLLVDCGFTLKQAESRLARLGVRPADLTAVLVTHEHADHVAGVAPLAHKYGLPVYASHGTLKAVRHQLPGRSFDGDVAFRIGGVEINPVRVPHDAREPTQFVFSAMGKKIGVISDLGCVTPHVVAQYQHCDAVLMEANHDVELLMQGRYPLVVKRRIASDLGHLSNMQAAEFLRAIMHPRLIVGIGHVSEENNSSEHLQAAFSGFETTLSYLGFAEQQAGLPWLRIDDRWLAEHNSPQAGECVRSGDNSFALV